MGKERNGIQWVWTIGKGLQEIETHEGVGIFDSTEDRNQATGAGGTGEAAVAGDEFGESEGVREEIVLMIWA